MKSLRMSLANSKELSKGEMKKITAGEESGSCCVHNSNWSVSGCGYSAADAQAAADTLAQQSGGHWYWCCASC